MLTAIVARIHLITILFVTFPLIADAQHQRFESLDAALSSGPLFSGNSGPRNITWFDEGERFSYIATNPETGSTEIRAYTVITDQDELIFDASTLTFPYSDAPFRYRSFQWAHDSKHILFQANFRPIYRHSGISDFYFYSIGDQTLELVATDAGTAELSPDGSRIGYERNGDLYVYSFESREETRLTFDGSEHIFNGRFGWVYEEEFTLTQAWSWSNDSKYIAYWQENETEVPIFQMTDYAGQHSEYVQIRYPKVGDTNPTVRIGVVDVASGDRRWLETGENPDSYIPRIYWTATEGQLAVVHMSRDQRHLKLYFFDVTSGARTLVFEEKSEQWVDIMNFFESIYHYFFFPTDAHEFYWVSDRDGFRHLYRYSYTGELLNQVTSGEWDVTNIYAFDPVRRLVFYASSEISPLERHLFSIGADGNNKRQVTTETGRHLINMSPNAAYFIDRWSNTETPTQVQLKAANGEQLKVFEDNAKVLKNIQKYDYSLKTLFSFTTSDNQSLDGYMVFPPDFDETKQYPAILDVYGGPGAQSVYNEFETSLWRQYLAQQGYIVVGVNNRGSSGYGREFEKQVYLNLGYWEAFDFNETGAYLASLPYVDGNRLAIRGHSYGGYAVLYTMTSYPDRFRVGISTAPVSDWRLYDTIYTERYMGLLGENLNGYEGSSPTSRAGNLKGKLLLVHSSMDENVHVQHTYQFVKALIDNRMDADLRIFPPGAHGVSYNTASYYYLMNLYTDYLNDNL